MDRKSPSQAIRKSLQVLPNSRRIRTRDFMVPQNLFGQYAQSTKTDVGKKEPYWVSVVREANKAFLHFFPQSKPLETAIKMVLESGKVFWDEFLLIGPVNSLFKYS